MTSEELKAIEARVSKASPAPWTCDKYGSLSCEYYDTWDKQLQLGIADAEFCAHAREDVPKLVAENRKLKTAVNTTARYLDALKEWSLRNQEDEDNEVSRIPAGKEFKLDLLMEEMVAAVMSATE